MRETKHKMIIKWSNEDDCYIMVTPELLGCMADGKILEEAIANTQEVISVWIKTQKEDGLPVPEPAGNEDITKTEEDNH